MATRVTCSECKRVYERIEVKFTTRDRDSYECRCGMQLESWNSSSVPTFRLIQDVAQGSHDA
jgi:hypothetical protein